MTLSTVQELPNRVDATGDEATIGSTTGVDANDPERLTHSGTAHYAYFPGTADNNLTVPDEAALDITDDLEIVFRLAPDDWTPAAAETIVNKSSSTYAARIQTSGDVRLYINNVGYDSTIAPTITDGVALWIKITRDRSTGDIDFYTAADQATEPSSWDTLGTTVAGVTDAIATGAADFYIGTNNSGTAPLQGIIQRVIVRSTIGGAAILDVNLPVDID
ncbi:MAG: hypothetical protein GY925_28145, partial [Actinomycetia bacterium]|nr:hypothetical protein [Actinomycetes bacterium]